VCRSLLSYDVKSAKSDFNTLNTYPSVWKLQSGNFSLETSVWKLRTAHGVCLLLSPNRSVSEGSSQEKWQKIEALRDWRGPEITYNTTFDTRVGGWKHVHGGRIDGP